MQPIVSGVYLLFHRHQLVYVGRSANCYKRIAEHHAKGRAFDYSLVTPCPADDARWVEEALLAAWGPAQNRQNPKGDPAKVVLLRQDAPPLALAMSIAQRRATACGASTLAFQEAIRSGEIPSFPKYPGRTGKGATRLVPVKALDAWCEAQQATRLAG